MLPRQPPKHSNNFNLLRLIFAVLVILGHSPELSDGNPSRELLTQIFHTVSFNAVGVYGFFLLSGYLIVQSWLARPKIFHFLSNRVLRIVPGFVVASLVCALIVGPLAADPHQYFSNFWIGGFVKNLFLLGAPKVPEVFRGTPYPAVNGSMWTIPLEFKCYLLVLVFGVTGALNRRIIWLAVTLVLLANLAAQQVLHTSDHPIIKLSTFFFVGGCFRLYQSEISYQKAPACLLGIILIVCMFFVQSAEIALAAAGGYLLFYFALTSSEVLSKFNKMPDVSYGVYLYAWPIQKLLLWHLPSMSPWLLFAISTVASLILGAASWYAVEKPFLAMKDRKLTRLPMLRTMRNDA